MPTKATPKDAELIMQLYDLRREPEMRKGRATGGSHNFGPTVPTSS